MITTTTMISMSVNPFMLRRRTTVILLGVNPFTLRPP